MSKVDIIVPIYNLENHLKKALDSLVNQSFKDFRVILIDDGSTDASIDIIKKYLNDDRFVLYQKENGGAASARNFGLEKSTSEYIMFFDGDDYAHDDLVEKACRSIQESDSDIVIFGFNSVDCLKELRKTSEYKNKSFTDGNKKEVLELSDLCVWNKIYKRELFLSLRFPENLIFEDFYLTICILTEAKKISSIDYIGIDYLIDRNGSVSNAYNSKSYDMFRIVDLIYEYFEKRNLLNKYHNTIRYLASREIIDVLISAVEKKDKDFIEYSYKYMDEKFGGFSKRIFIEDKKKIVYFNRNILNLYLDMRSKF